MLIRKRLDELAALGQPLHLALGVFDGVHIGHQAVIARAVEAASRDGGLAGLLTFDPHPIRVIAPEKAPASLLATLNHKAEIVEEGKGWFHLSAGFEIDGEKFDLQPILAALVSNHFLETTAKKPPGQEFLVFLPDGRGNPATVVRRCTGEWLHWQARIWTQRPIGSRDR